MSQASEKESVVLAALEAERERRIDEAVERGEGVRVPLVVVCAAADDLEAARIRAQSDKTAELRKAGERRKPVFDELAIMTGVPRPGRDDKHSARLEAEFAALTAEQRQQRGAAAAATVEAFHEAAKDHEPQPSAPMPRPVLEPPSALAWIPIVVGLSGPSSWNPAGTCVEGKFGVADFVLFVADAEGRFLTSRALQPEDDPRAIARQVLRETFRPDPFYGDLPYKKPGIW